MYVHFIWLILQLHLSCPFVIFIAIMNIVTLNLFYDYILILNYCCITEWWVWSFNSQNFLLFFLPLFILFWVFLVKAWQRQHFGYLFLSQVQHSTSVVTGPGKPCGKAGTCTAFSLKQHTGFRDAVFKNILERNVVKGVKCLNGFFSPCVSTVIVPLLNCALAEWVKETGLFVWQWFS